MLILPKHLLLLLGININILECKLIKVRLKKERFISININILECKFGRTTKT